MAASVRSHPALGRLIAVDPDEFGQRYWGTEPLVSRAAGLPGAVHELFSVAAVDELVSKRGLRAPFLRVAKNGSTYSDRDFTDGGGAGAAVTDQVSDDKLLRLFAGGATLVLQGLHRTWPALIDFTQALAGELGHPVQANAYVTPAQNTGFNDHYDVHDVFVVQVSGAKTWRVRRPVHTSPLRDQPWATRRSAVERAAQAPALFEITLQPGDCLYLPRGYLHSATALGGVSTHLTLGVHVWTVRHLADEMMTLAIERASRSDAVRASLPALVDVTDPGAVGVEVETARAALVDALAHIDPAEVTAALATRLRRSQRAAPVAPVRQTLDAAALSELDGIRLREHLAATVVRHDHGAVVRSRVADFSLGDDELDSVSALLENGNATVGNLGLELARRLVLAGLAVRD